MTVSKGYPENMKKERSLPDSTAKTSLFHSGTKIEGQNIVTSGGRVIVVTSMDKDLKIALEKSYKTISKIDFDGKTIETI